MTKVDIGGAHAGTQTWDRWHAGALAFNARHPVEAEEDSQTDSPSSTSRLRPSSPTPTCSLRPVSHRARTQCSKQPHQPCDEASHRKQANTQDSSRFSQLGLRFSEEPQISPCMHSSASPQRYHNVADHPCIHTLAKSQITSCENKSSQVKSPSTEGLAGMTHRRRNKKSFAGGSYYCN